MPQTFSYYGGDVPDPVYNVPCIEKGTIQGRDFTNVQIMPSGESSSVDLDLFTDHSANSIGTLEVNGLVLSGKSFLSKIDIEGLRAGGTDVTTLTLTFEDPPGPDLPSTISGTEAGQAITGNTTIDPFANVTITDSNTGSPTETVTVTPSSTTNGTLSDTVGGTVDSNGVYTVTDSASAVTTDLDALTFTPAAIAPGQTITTGFTISDTNSAELTTTDSTTSVIDTAPAVASTISGTEAGQAITGNTTIDPFANVTITDSNSGSPTETVTVTPSSTLNGTLSDSVGGTVDSNGVYTVTGSASTVTTDLDALTFTPAAIAPGQTITTGFTISDTNSANLTTTDSTTTVVATAPFEPSTIAGTVPGQTTTDEATNFTPFTHVTITDPNGAGATEAVTVTPSSTLNGTLSDSVGGTVDSNGVYTVTGTASTVTTDLEALTFTPTPHEVAPDQVVTTGFTISDTNSANLTATDNTTSVVATAVDDPPTLITPVLSDTVAEGQTLQGLYNQLLANVSDPDFGAQAKLTISSIGQPKMGFLTFDPTNHVLTYTASGFNPSQPTDSFTYTVPDPYGGGSVTGTVDVTVTGANIPTLVGTNVTANGTGQRLIGTNSNSTLVGHGGNDEIFGGSGNDTITADGANSTIDGGAGTNTITLNGAHDTVVLEQGGLDQISGFKLGQRGLARPLAGARRVADQSRRGLQQVFLGEHIRQQFDFVVQPRWCLGGPWDRARCAAWRRGQHHAQYADQ